MTVQFYLLLKRTASSQNVRDFEVPNNELNTHTHTQQILHTSMPQMVLKCLRDIVSSQYTRMGTTSVVFPHSLHDLYEQNKQN